MRVKPTFSGTEKAILLQFFLEFSRRLAPLGCWACSLLLEQRIHHVFNKRQRLRDSTDHVSSIVSKQQESLEQNYPWTYLQCFEAFYGDEPKAVRWLHSEIQSWAGGYSLKTLSFYFFKIQFWVEIFSRKKNGRDTESELKHGKRSSFWRGKIPRLKI